MTRTSEVLRGEQPVVTELEATTGFGGALRALRTAAGMTLEEVSDAAGVSLSYLSRAENDQVTPTAGWVQMVTVAIGDHMKADQTALLMTIAAAAERLSIKPWAMLKLADAGAVRTVWLGRRRLVVAESLREYVASLSEVRS